MRPKDFLGGRLDCPPLPVCRLLCDQASTFNVSYAMSFLELITHRLERVSMAAVGIIVKVVVWRV